MPTSQLLLYPLAINFNILSWQLSDKNHPAIEPEDTWVQIPWDLKIPWEGNGNPLHYSCQDNPMGKGAWQTIVWGAGGGG